MMRKVELDKFDRGIPTLLFQAHCDDESFLCAGLINQLVQGGHRVILIYFASEIVPNEPNTSIRRTELSAACEILRVNDVRFLDFCEPKYDTGGCKPLFLQSTEDVLQNLEETIRDILDGRFNVVSYDENGGYGNKDHVIVNRVCRLLLVRHAENIVHFYEVTINRDLYLNAVSENENTLPKLKYWSNDFGLPEDTITDYYDLSLDQIILKRAALAAHASQIKIDEFPMILSPKSFADFFGREYFLKIK